IRGETTGFQEIFLPEPFSFFDSERMQHDERNKSPNGHRMTHPKWPSINCPSPTQMDLRGKWHQKRQFSRTRSATFSRNRSREFAQRESDRGQLAA
ncbi:MAG TPA: hypothetical protein VGG33_05000, partial [Polyangia bacterium]